MDQKEKEELFEVELSEGGLSGKFLFLLIALFVVAVFFWFPKIYLSNEIYYKSRQINKLLDDYQILKEENRILKRKIEYEKYKNNILGTIFGAGEDD